jgi:antitoxin component of RelBE/YafQ-DinJ toxin-antitoxin module
MKKTVKKPTTIRLDEQTKKWAQSFARLSGIDLSTLITLSLRETQKKGVVTAEPVMSDKKFAFYMDYIKQIDEWKIPTKKYNSLEDMKKDYLK